MTGRLEFAISAAREAGQHGMGLFARRDELQVLEKGAQDRVTMADRQLETMIRKRIGEAFPDDGIIGEEFGASDVSGRGTWIIDPIDGTDCFVFGLPSWSVTIAYIEDGATTVGVVYDPVHDEMYAASKGGGATLNGKTISVADAAGLTDGLVGIGHSSRVTPGDTMRALDRLLQNGGLFHRCGSGALSLAWVAAGRLIAYYEPHINAWDCLAGLLLIDEAGGWTNDFLAGDGLATGGPIFAAAPGVATEIRTMGGFDGVQPAGDHAPLTAG